MKGWLSKRRAFLFRLAGTLLATALTFFLIEQEGLDEILSAVRQVSPANFSLALACLFLSRLFVSARWHVLVRAGGVQISYFKTSALTFAGLFASNFLPTTIGGDVVRLVSAIQMGMDQALALASLAADRLIGMLGMACLLPFGISPVWHSLSAPVLQSAALGGLFQRAWEFVKRTLRVFSTWIERPAALFLSLVFTWLHSLCVIAAFYIVISGLGASISFFLIAGLWSLAYFVTLMPVSINGYGVQELSLTFLFSQVGGLSAAASLTVAVAIRLLYMAASLPGAAYLPSIIAALNWEERTAGKE
jgi:uncharacterized membrane protein YbhN (UPF0104 family)